MNSRKHQALSEEIVRDVKRRSKAYEGEVGTHKEVMAEHAYVQNNLLMALVHATLANIPAEPDPYHPPYEPVSRKEWS